MFSNLHIYRLTREWDMTAERLEELVGKRPFQPCGSQDQKSAGWVSPQEHGPLVHALGRQWLLALRIETKSVPGEAIKKAVAEKSKDYEQRNGYKPGRKVVKDMKEEALMELLPRAFPKQATIQVWINAEAGWIAMNTSTPSKADDVVAALIETSSTAPISLVRTNQSPAQAMADWLTSGEAPDNFTVDRDCELKGTEDEKPTVKYSRLSLERDEIRQHIEEGKRPTKLAMTWDDRASFILTDKGQVKKLVFLDAVMEEINLDAEDADAVFHSTFAIMTAELSRFFPDLVESLGGEAEYEAE
ncbi:recombination-associated protein RdgC (plasmid) [Burkholderia sp. SFA1]|nr:recombination associated protein [Burkholderia sp. YI23]BBQ03143.1 recombination-associated protein RdgC [Burkholderia sp. SFA1]